MNWKAAIKLTVKLVSDPNSEFWIYYQYVINLGLHNFLRVIAGKEWKL